MGTKTNTGLVDYARHQVGQAYWWGCYGQVADERLLEVKTKQYPEVYKAALYDDAKEQFGKRVFDCNGLVKGYLWMDRYDSQPRYNPAQDCNSVGMFTNCTETGLVSSMPEIPGLVLFTSSLDHVGVYIGNGKVIESRGHKYGVVESSLGDRYFYRWGKPKWIQYEREVYEFKEPYYDLNSDDQRFIDKLGQLKLGDSGINVYLMQSLLSHLQYMTATTGNFDNGTRYALIDFQSDNVLEVDGICGKNTWTALIK